MTFRSILFAGALALAASAAQAVPIISSSTGLAAPATTITFDEVALAQNTPLTNQFAAFGVTFSPGVTWYSPQTGFGHVQGNDGGNFTFNGDSSFAPLRMSFGNLQTGVAFAMAANGQQYLFEALLANAVVESFQTAVNVSSNDYYGFQGIAFDGIRLSNLQNNFYVFDNIQLSAGGAGVPEPETWSLMIVGFGMAGAMVRRRRVMA